MRARWVVLGVGLAVAGCASVLGIPNDSPSFCAQPANQGHAYCEDFDVGDAGARWTFAETIGNGAAYGLQPSDDTPPNLLDMSVGGVPEGGAAVAGFDKEFDDSTFVGLHIEADVRFVSQGDAGATAQGGFLLITDKSGGCIGLGVGARDATHPVAGIGAVVFSKATACSLLTGGGGPSDVAPAQTFLTTAPQPDKWFHAVVVVAPAASGDGSGTLTFNIVGQPESSPTIPLPPGTLVPTGIPLVGFAAQTNGPSGSFEVQFDDVTIDLRPN
jgi:hypothetical protein